MTSELMKMERDQRSIPSIGARLISQIDELRAKVGEGLNDVELSQLILKKIKCEDKGFAILCFSEGIVTFCVPEQKPEEWYPVNRWISEEKNRSHDSLRNGTISHFASRQIVSVR